MLPQERRTYKNALYSALKLIALTAVFAYNFTADTVSGFSVAAVLAFCCLFMIDLLICRISKKKSVKFICIPVQIGGCFLCGTEVYFPLLLVLIYQLIDLLDAGEYTYHISAASALLVAFIFTPGANSAVTAVIISAVWLSAKIILEKLEYYREICGKQREEISALAEKNSRLKAYSKTLRETASLEERGRFSARIHDKLGQGISGSIILLEGAKLNIKNDPEQAEKCLGTAIENLRGSVDSIREALREERPGRSAAGIAECREMLEKFTVTYGIKTDISIEGDSEKITPQIWKCLKENLTEAMTNTVKHSKADCFDFRIFVYSKIIRAEFSDNGQAADTVKKGIGLEAIEDRTAACGGNCIFRSENAGFTVICIFKI